MTEDEMDALTATPAPRKRGGFLRTCVYVALAWTLAPLLILGAVEIGLRLAHYGHTTRPFLKYTVDGKQYAAVNMRFFEQFMPMWPDAIGTEPYDVAIPVEKPPNTYRVAVLGSSAAFGYFHPEYSLWRVLNVLLRAKYPGVNFEVYCLGWNGMNSHVMRYMANASRFLNFDLFVVYMGNNEVKGTLALMYDMSKRYPTHLVVKAYALLSDLRIMQAASRGIAAVMGRPENLRAWEESAGYSSMDDPWLQRVYRNYRENVASIVDTASSAGAATVLCTVGTNLRTIYPGNSSNSAKLSGQASQEWNNYYQEGMARENAKAYPEAIERYRKALDIDDYHADMLFRLATCYWATGEYDKAREFYTRAHEQDFALVSANAHINDAIRDETKACAGKCVYLADVAQRLAEKSPHGIPGDEFFEDHVHLTFDGCYEAACAIYERLAPELPEWIRSHLQGDTTAPSLDDCKEHMAVTAGDLLDLLAYPLSCCAQTGGRRPPDYYLRLQEAYKKDLEGKNRCRMDADACRRALVLDGGDYYILRKCVNLLLQLGQRDEAEKDARMLAAQYPYHWGTWNTLTNVLWCQNKQDEAMQAFARLLNDLPKYAETYNVWGNRLAARGQLEQAVAAYRKAASQKRVNTVARLAEANLLVRLGNVDDAAQIQREVILAFPDRAEGYQALDDLLKARKPMEERVTVWRDLSARLPKLTTPLTRLGVALEDVVRLDEAITTLQSALDRDPNSTQAKEALTRCRVKKEELVTSGSAS